MKYEKVTSLGHLDKLIGQGHHDYCIARGIIRSSKYITWNGTDKYYVLHYIDDTEEQLTADEIMQSNIGKSITNGNFYCEL